LAFCREGGLAQTRTQPEPPDHRSNDIHGFWLCGALHQT
jgi:hypothetical protein